MRRPLWIAAVLALAGGAAPAAAHDLTCEKTVNGAVSISVAEYPATLHYQWTVHNVADAPSTVLSLHDSVTATVGLAEPITIPVGGSTSGAYDVAVASYEACVALAAAHACTTGCGPGVLDNVLSARFDLGEAQCRARVTCLPPGPPPTTGATRTMGFFKTHVDAARACVAAGPIALGPVTVTTVEDLLGLLWASVPRFATGEARNALEQSWLLLARQTAVATCNERLFGTSSGGLVASAVAALGTTSCGAIGALVAQVDAFNNSGDANPFPSGFSPGTATPSAAAALAVDPTSPSGQACTP